MQCRMMQGDCYRDYGFHCVQWTLYYRIWNAICWDNCVCTYTPIGGVGSGSGIMLKDPNSDTDAITSTAPTSLSPAAEPKDLVTRTEEAADVANIAEAWEMQCSKYPKTCASPPWNFRCDHYNLEYDDFNIGCWENCQCVYVETPLSGGCRSSNKDGSSSCIISRDSALGSENMIDSTTPTFLSLGPSTGLVTRSVVVAEDLGFEKDKFTLDHASLTSSTPVEDLSDTAITGRTVDSAGLADIPGATQIPDDWFLDCSGITNTCGGRPYRYVCSSTGRLSRSQRNNTCDNDCQCKFQSIGDGGCRASSAEGSTSCTGVEEPTSGVNQTDATSDDSGDFTEEE